MSAVFCVGVPPQPHRPTYRGHRRATQSLVHPSHVLLRVAGSRTGRRGGSTSYGTAAQQGGYGHRGGGYGAQQGSGGGRGRGAGDHGGAGGGSAYLDLPLVPHSGHLAVDCVRNDTTHGASLADLERAVTPQHLLQFGALLGESSAELALSQAGAEGALGCSPRCLFGATDNEAQCARGWEPIADESCARRGLHYQAWRRYLRKGLYMYKSRTGAALPALCVAMGRRQQSESTPARSRLRFSLLRSV